MYDKESRRIIEALRSGVPSRAVGEYFSESRPKIREEISGKLDRTVERNKSCGMIFSGKYGEGKTHLLNTVFGMAEERNMVVSYVSISKETPVDKLHVLYQKLIAGTYLPGHRQPGFLQELDKLTPNSPAGSELMMYAAKQLQTDKLYYLLRSYYGTEDEDEKFLLRSDMEGDFISNAELKRIYKRIYAETVKYNVNFSKTRHCGDYYDFMSHFFKILGYDGWVILFDETELIGRMGKKTRLKAYRNMGRFLMPPESFRNVFSLFAISASYGEDVIESRNEYENVELLPPEEQGSVKDVLDLITSAQQLVPLSQAEIRKVFEDIIDIHGMAYGWTPAVGADELMKVSERSGYLLRTKIRSSIEQLDQLYQYGDMGNSVITELSREDLDEDPDQISLDEIL